MKTVLGIFSDREYAERAVNRLEDEGFRPQDISIVMKDRGDAKHVAQSTGADVAGGATTGVATGAIIGGIAGLLVGVGAIALPGFGLLLAAGPLAASLGLTGAAATTASGAVTGAVAGGLIGALVSLGLPEEDARIYESRIREGGILVAVPTAIRGEELVRDILDDEGAEQIRTVRSSASDTADAQSYERIPSKHAGSRGMYAGAKGGRRTIGTEDNLSDDLSSADMTDADVYDQRELSGSSEEVQNRGWFDKPRRRPSSRKKN
jgi:hypothetical protein